MFFLANWAWSLKPHKRAQAINIDSSRKIAYRAIVGHNPGVMTIYPFTEICNYFQVRIQTLGKFVGIGKNSQQ